MIHAAGIILRVPDGRVLLLRRSGQGDHAGKWALPGGKIEDGETPEQAVARECREEIGPVSYGALRQVARTKNDTVDYITFLADIGRPFRPNLNDEHTDAVWAQPSDPPVPLHPGVSATFREIHAMLERESAGKAVNLTDSQLDEAVILSFPTVIKARPVEPNGRRIVEVEAAAPLPQIYGAVSLARSPPAVGRCLGQIGSTSRRPAGTSRSLCVVEATAAPRRRDSRSTGLPCRNLQANNPCV